MGLTETYGFSMFGGSQGGDISDDGYKFSIRDRQIIEALFVRLFGHTHTAAAQLVDPATPPALALGTDPAASIPAGVALYYRVSYVDAYGGETAASEEYTISTPDPVDTPDTPAALAVTGGSLPNGATYYLVTFYQTVGGETEPSDSTVVTIIGSTGDKSVELELPAIATGADGWRIYKRGPSQSSFYFLADQPVASGTTYTDDGTVIVDATRPVSTVNDTNSTNKVTVTAPLVAGVVPTDVARWRIYRSFESGVYADQSLVHEVVERTDELDPTSPLVTTWDDVGDTLFDGIPLDISNCAGDAPQISGTTGITGGASFQNGQDVYVGAFVAGLASAWVTGTFAETEISSSTVDLTRSGDVRMNDFQTYDVWNNFYFPTGRWVATDYEAYQDALVAGSAVLMKRHGIVGAPEVVTSTDANTALRSLSAWIDSVLTAGTLDVELLVNGATVDYVPTVWVALAFAGWSSATNATITSTTGAVAFHPTADGAVELLSPAGAVTGFINMTGWQITCGADAARLATLTVEFLNASNAVVLAVPIIMHLSPEGVTKIPYQGFSQPAGATQVRFRLHVAGALGTDTYVIAYLGGVGGSPGDAYCQDGASTPVKLTFNTTSGQVVSLDLGDPTWTVPFVNRDDLITFRATPSGTISPVPKVITKAQFCQS